MAGLRCVFNHPRLLVDDSPSWRAIARAAPLAIFGVAARVDGDVDRGCAGYAALAGHLALPIRLGLDRGGPPVRLRAVCVFAIREEFQREATRRTAGSSWRGPRAAAGNGWNPGTGAASGVPGASLRDAGLERGDQPGGVLGADGVRRGHGSGDDPDGGC